VDIRLNMGDCLLEKLSILGVKVAYENDKLKVADPENNLSPELLDQLKTHKAEVIQELVLSQVRGQNNEPIDNKEFTRRYLILMHAHRAGIVNTDGIDKGLDALLDVWDRKLDDTTPPIVTTLFEREPSKGDQHDA
jgi:hypothetical protein